MMLLLVVAVILDLDTQHEDASMEHPDAEMEMRDG